MHLNVNLYVVIVKMYSFWILTDSDHKYNKIFLHSRWELMAFFYIYLLMIIWLILCHPCLFIQDSFSTFKTKIMLSVVSSSFCWPLQITSDDHVSISSCLPLSCHACPFFPTTSINLLFALLILFTWQLNLQHSSLTYRNYFFLVMRSNQLNFYFLTLDQNSPAWAVSLIGTPV